MQDSNEKDDKKAEMNEENGTIDNAGLSMNGHIIIRDKETGEEFINKRCYSLRQHGKNCCTGLE